MDEEQQYLANLSYQEEQKDQEYFNVLKMRANGISDEGIQRNYADFAVRQQPTFNLEKTLHINNCMQTTLSSN
jgi:hypothetical protein